MVHTQFVIVERCRSCGICGCAQADSLTNMAPKQADTSTVSSMADLAVDRFAEVVKQLQGEIATIARVQAQMVGVLKGTRGASSQAIADLEHVAAGANEVSLTLKPAKPENNAENEGSKGEKAAAGGGAPKKKKKKAVPETNFRNDVRWRCGGG